MLPHFVGILFLKMHWQTLQLELHSQVQQCDPSILFLAGDMTDALSLLSQQTVLVLTFSGNSDTVTFSMFGLFSDFFSCLITVRHTLQIGSISF